MVRAPSFRSRWLWLLPAVAVTAAAPRLLDPRQRVASLPGDTRLDAVRKGILYLETAGPRREWLACSVLRPGAAPRERYRVEMQAAPGGSLEGMEVHAREDGVLILTRRRLPTPAPAARIEGRAGPAPQAAVPPSAVERYTLARLPEGEGPAEVLARAQAEIPELFEGRLYWLERTRGGAAVRVRGVGESQSREASRGPWGWLRAGEDGLYGYQYGPCGAGGRLFRLSPGGVRFVPVLDDYAGDSPPVVLGDRWFWLELPPGRLDDTAERRLMSAPTAGGQKVRLELPTDQGGTVLPAYVAAHQGRLLLLARLLQPGTPAGTMRYFLYEVRPGSPATLRRLCEDTGVADRTYLLNGGVLLDEGSYWFTVLKRYENWLDWSAQGLGQKSTLEVFRVRLP